MGTIIYQKNIATTFFNNKLLIVFIYQKISCIYFTPVYVIKPSKPFYLITIWRNDFIITYNDIPFVKCCFQWVQCIIMLYSYTIIHDSTPVLFIKHTMHAPMISKLYVMYIYLLSKYFNYSHMIQLQPWRVLVLIRERRR